MAFDINKFIADTTAARAAAVAQKAKADALAASLKNLTAANKSFKTEAQNKLNYANTLQKSLTNFEDALVVFATQIARDGKLSPVDQKEFDRVVAQYKKTDAAYKATIKEANTILAKAPTPVKVETKNGEAVVPGVTTATEDKGQTAKTPDDFAALLKTAPQFIAKMSGKDRKFLAQSLNDSLGLKLPVSESIAPETLLGAYQQAISGAQARYNVFKDVTTLSEYLDKKKTEVSTQTATGTITPPITDYPVISSPTDVKKLVNSVFQTNLNRDATDAEIKLLSPLLKDAQLKNPTYYKKTTLNGKVAQIQYSGLDSGQWILDQITSNKDLNLKAELETAKTQAPDLAKRLEDKKIYDKLITAAKGDPTKIAMANETTTYGRGLKELLATIRSVADANGATNTPEELTTLAKTLFDKGIAANSAEASAEIDKAFKSGVGLVADQATIVKTIAANKKIYDKLIAAAGDDPAKIAAANETTEYGRGLSNIVAALKLKAKDNGAINTPEELAALAKKLYDQGIALDSNEGVTAVDAILKNKTGLVADQAADLTKITADKAIYEKLVAAANGDPALIAKAKQTTAYGRGLASVEAGLKSKLFKSGATNTAEEVTALAQDLYDNGINPASDEGLAKINSLIKFVPDAKTGKYAGAAATAIADLQATAAANGLDLQKNFGDQIPGWLTAINNGEDPKNIKQQIRDVAKLGQPDSIKKLIDSGTDLKTIYAPYRNTMASVLEIQDPNSIKLDDPSLRMAITPEGELNLYDYTKTLRKDNRWQYTQQAHTEVADTTQKVLRDFGFMG
jgi:hypothetical protein